MKKQLLELNQFYFRSQQTGKRRTKIGTILFSALWAATFVFLGVMFFFVAHTMIEPLMSIGANWMYFCFVSLAAIFFGTIGSVFTTYAWLYQAKDNELLLSMPIPPWKILLSRIVGVTATGLLYESAVLIPAIIARCLYGHLSFPIVLGMVLMCINVALIVTVITCGLGWVIALIATRLKGKSVLTALISVVCLGVYLYFCGVAPSAIETWADDPTVFLNIGDTLKTSFYPFYLIGAATEGDLFKQLVTTVVCVAALSAVWLILSKTFLHISTRQSTAVNNKKNPVQFGHLRNSSTLQALVYKEWKRFTSSSTYMLNCGLAVVLLPVLTVMLIINLDKITPIIEMLSFLPFAKGIILLILCGVLGLAASTNVVSAPSISLEGKTLWMLQTMPVSPLQVLHAKYALHMLITLPVSAVCGTVVACVLHQSPLSILTMLLFVTCFVSLIALVGLALNLKMPNLNWTSESAPVKQSMSVMISLFGGWVLIALLGFVYYLLRYTFQPMIYLLLVSILLLLCNAALYAWLKKRGTVILAHL